ncbi:MAG: hypothetical protein ACKOUM_05370 [Sphingopyxis sp.]
MPFTALQTGFLPHALQFAVRWPVRAAHMVKRVATPAINRALDRALDGADVLIWGQRDNLFLWLPVAYGAGIAMWFGLPGALAWVGALLVLAAVVIGAIIGGAAHRLTMRVVLIGAVAAMAGMLTIWAKSSYVAAPCWNARQ